MTFSRRIKKKALVFLGVYGITLSSLLCYSSLLKHNDSSAKVRALETAEIVLESVSSINPEIPLDIFSANLSDKRNNIDYTISIEPAERRLTIESKVGKDYTRIFIDEGIDGKLDEAYILKYEKDNNKKEIYKSDNPKGLEGLFRKDLEKVHEILKSYKEIKKKMAKPKGQLV